MLPEQCAAGALYDPRLQKSREKVCNIQLYTDVCCTSWPLCPYFRHTGENPDTECIDHHLQTLFDDLEHKIARTEGITKKLDIKQGTDNTHTNTHK